MGLNFFLQDFFHMYMTLSFLYFLQFDHMHIHQKTLPAVFMIMSCCVRIAYSSWVRDLRCTVRWRLELWQIGRPEMNTTKDCRPPRSQYTVLDKYLGFFNKGVLPMDFTLALRALNLLWRDLDLGNNGTKVFDGCPWVAIRFSTRFCSSRSLSEA